MISSWFWTAPISRNRETSGKTFALQTRRKVCCKGLGCGPSFCLKEDPKGCLKGCLKVLLKERRKGILQVPLKGFLKRLPKGNQKECLQGFLQREKIPKQMPKKNPKGKQGFSTFTSRRSAARESKTKQGPRMSFRSKLLSKRGS